MSLKILIGSVFSISSVVRFSADLPTFFVADLPGKVEVDCSEVSLVYIVVEGPYRTRDGFLIRSKDMGQRLSLQKQRGNQTVQLFQGLRSLVNPRP